MLDKFKLRKAPLSLSSVSNALRNSGSASLTPEILAKHLKIVAGDQLGLPKDSVVAASFDPVQSLLAVATKRGSVHVYGQNCVEVVFELRTSGTISDIRFVKGVYLVCVEALGNVTVLSLHTKQILATYLAPGAITAVETDPSMDWLILGMANGAVLFYDVDRFHLTPLRIDNLQKLVLPKQKMSPVHSIQWHPRDIGTILVSYSHCAVQYSLSSGAIKNAFIYKLTPGCKGFEFLNNFETGGKKKLFGSVKEVICRMREAHYHPNGLHVLTAHDDGSLVFFDANDGTLLQARTMKDTYLHLQGPSVHSESSRELRLAWVTGQDPEDTRILVSGSSEGHPDIIEVLDLGFTLKYTLTSHEKQGDFYARSAASTNKLLVKFNRRLQSEGAAEHIVKLLPIAAEGQPYFQGGHNPSHVLVITNFGGVHLVQLEPTTTPIKVPPSLQSICPPMTFSTVQTVRRVDWFGVVSNRRNGPGADFSLVSGGAPVDRHFPRPIGSEDGVNDILISGHEDGTVRCLDVTAGERQGGESTIEFNLKDTLDTGAGSAPYRVTHVSFAFECRHAVVGLANGNVAICKFGKVATSSLTPPTRKDYTNCPVLHTNGDASIVDLGGRILGQFIQPSFIPSTLLNLTAEDKILCLKMSNAGFAAVGYKSGRLVVCDISRGPAVILNLESVTKHLPSVSGQCFVTAIEFAIMEYGQDGFSSLLMFIGTNAGGNFLTFKIVPQRSGAFEAVFADKTLGLNYRSADPTGESGIDRIMPVHATTGESAVATLETFQRLGQSILVPGLVVISSTRDLRVLKTPKQKLAHKVVDETCVASGIVTFRNKGAALATVTKSGFIKLFSLPSLSDIADVKIPSEVFKRLKESLESGAALTSSVLYSGEIFLKVSPSEVLNLFLYDETKNKTFKVKPTDTLFNDTAIIPTRPSSGALLWAKGQITYISNKDLTALIAGPNRKPAKHPESELAYNISPEANPNQSYGTYGGANPNKAKEGYAEPVRRTATTNPYAIGTQRFVRGLRDGLDSVEEQVNNYASGFSEAMTESVDTGKKSMYSLAFKSKFGF
ncbi:Lethal giant larvae(Lgl) like, C-terminal [Metschnikowia aff. pulcherrima]|uniref:Lethal giant larvae(Lgl) like, C-terminal n=1 Tax=Metschnikowia aff. pulcherrima TaxID=2163413 RepID=A0A4P6XJ13_9ASCO|nr:Lethal giant larvae(Lgl) like, C-terminal [Metschnikowia aff. pulcherrima]